MESIECRTRGSAFRWQCLFVNIIGFALHVGLHSPFLAKPEAEAGDSWLFNCPQDHGPSYSYVGAKAVRLELRVELGRQQQATSLETDV